MNGYEICGCVEKSGLSGIPVLCSECNYGDDDEACKEAERLYYIYKKVE